MRDGHVLQLNSERPDAILLGVTGLDRLAAKEPGLVRHLAEALGRPQDPVVVERLVRALEKHVSHPEAAAALERFRRRARR